MKVKVVSGWGGASDMTESRWYRHEFGDELDDSVKWYRHGWKDERDFCRGVYFSRKRRIRRRTLAYIAGVTLPVAVFCWLGWYTPNSRVPAAGRSTSAPWAKGYAAREVISPWCLRMLR